MRAPSALGETAANGNATEARIEINASIDTSTHRKLAPISAKNPQIRNIYLYILRISDLSLSVTLDGILGDSHARTRITRTLSTRRAIRTARRGRWAYPPLPMTPRRRTDSRRGTDTRRTRARARDGGADGGGDPKIPRAKGERGRGGPSGWCLGTRAGADSEFNASARTDSVELRHTPTAAVGVGGWRESARQVGNVGARPDARDPRGRTPALSARSSRARIALVTRLRPRAAEGRRLPAGLHLTVQVSPSRRGVASDLSSRRATAPRFGFRENRARAIFRKVALSLAGVRDIESRLRLRREGRAISLPAAS